MLKLLNIKLTIAIDGPAGAGKSSAAKLLAQKLGYTYVDTGLMYRVIAWAAVTKAIIPDNKSIIDTLFSEFKIEFQAEGVSFKVLAQAENITHKLRTPDVSRYASLYSGLPAVRDYLLGLQRKMGQSGGVIMEGRDIGTVIFPEADCKFFLDADTKERALRRHQELKAKDNPTKLTDTIRDIQKRDAQDSRRKLAPLKKAADAIVIDSTNLTLEQVVDMMLSHIDRVT